MDVVALAQAGIPNAVATLGTATGVAHFEKLFRATPEVVCCFDGDTAGREAAWKALTVALPAPKYWHTRHQHRRIAIGSAVMRKRTFLQRQPPSISMPHILHAYLRA